MTDSRPKTEQELVEQIRSLDVQAPEALHRQVESMIAARSSRAGRLRARRAARGADSTGSTGPARAGVTGAARERSFSIGPRLAAGGAIAAAVIALALAFGLSGSSSSLSVRDAAALTLRRATFSAPSETNSDSGRLNAAVEGVSFPYWGGRFGWRSTGMRADHVDGRAVTTVFYESARGHRVGYAIVSGRAPSRLSGVVSVRDGTQYRLLTIDGVAVVTWLRDGHLCVISGRGVGGATLLHLASWETRRPVSS